MKKIYFIRHADWDHETGNLSEKGKKQCEEVRETLPKFDLIITTNSPRTQQTARLLTGKESIIDERVNPLPLTKEEIKVLAEKSKAQKYGMAGAILDTPTLVEPLKRRGKESVSLLHEILEKIAENQNALIISHDGVIVAAEKILKHEKFDKINNYYNPLEGIILNESLQIEKFKHNN